MVIYKVGVEHLDLIDTSHNEELLNRTWQQQKYSGIMEGTEEVMLKRKLNY